MPWTYTVSWHHSGPKLSGPEWINEQTPQCQVPTAFPPNESMAPVKNSNANAINYLGSAIRMLSTIKSAMWKCSNCLIDPFNSSQDLYTHLELNHNAANIPIDKKNPGRQKKNPKQKKKRLGKMEDPKTRSDYDQIFLSICSFCRTAFESFRSQKFQKKEMNFTKRIHQCSLCDSKFLNHQTLQHHYKKLHLCYTCNTTLTVLGNFTKI